MSEWSIDIEAHGPMSTTLDPKQLVEALAGRQPVISVNEVKAPTPRLRTRRQQVYKRDGAEVMLGLRIQFTVEAVGAQAALVRGFSIFDQVAPAMSIARIEATAG